MNVGAGSPGFLLIIINLNKPAQPLIGTNINPVLLTLNFGGVGRVYQDYLSDLKDFVEPAPTVFILIIGLETRFLGGVGDTCSI